MSTNIVATAEVNPVDIFIQDQIGLTELMYKFIVGALTVLVAVRLGDLFKVMAEEVNRSLQLTESPLLVSLVDVALTLVFVLVFSALAKKKSSPKKRS